MKLEYPKVYISDMTFEESCYIRGDLKWKASSLYKEAELQNLKPFDYPLAVFDLTSSDIFDLENINSFIFQCKRVQNCDKSIPIILDDYGQIADGYHRICRAIIDGDTTIKAYRLTKMPKEDYLLNT